MSPARRQLEGTELLERMRLVGEAFRPAAPTDRRDLFAGRTEQIGELFAVLGQPGQHAVVYGERGVGKTSLVNVTAQMIRDSNVLVARATCDASDEFGSVWRKALEEIVIRTVLVPAAMELLGERNWYLPRWLGWLPHYEVEADAKR